MGSSSVLTDTEIGGVKIPAGSNLLLLLALGNRDEAVFPQRDHLEVTRANARNHLSSGFGIHYCLGQQLAKMEFIIAMKELGRCLPSLRLIPGQTPAFAHNTAFRRPCNGNGICDDHGTGPDIRAVHHPVQGRHHRRLSPHGRQMRQPCPDDCAVPRICPVPALPGSRTLVHGLLGPMKLSPGSANAGVACLQHAPCLTAPITTLVTLMC